MLRNIALALAGAALSISAPLGAAETATASFTLTLRVPVLCTVRHRPIGVAVSGDTANLGELDEYCNAPQGYELTVDYTPGSLQGTVLVAGDDHVVLDGSGHAVLSRATGPRFRARPLTAVAGSSGFDSGSLNFQIRPA